MEKKENKRKKHTKHDKETITKYGEITNMKQLRVHITNVKELRLKLL